MTAMVDAALVEIGGMGGPEITLSGHALRSNAFRILGSGFSSVTQEALNQALREVAEAIADGGLLVRPRPAPLAEVEKAWTHQDAPGERTVIIP
ncbi:hypothetical protein [Nocardia thraciensis]